MNDGSLIGNFLLLRPDITKKNASSEMPITFVYYHVSNDNHQHALIDEIVSSLNHSTTVVVIQSANQYHPLAQFLSRQLIKTMQFLNNTRACHTDRLTFETVHYQLAIFMQPSRRDRYTNSQPLELKQTLPCKSDGTFIAEYVTAGLSVVKNIYIFHNNSRYSINISHPPRYYLFIDQNDRPRPIYFDERHNAFYLNNSSSINETLDYIITDGMTCAEIYGSQYQLFHDKSKNKMAIMIQKNKQNSHASLIYIYREPLSKSWHLSRYNNWIAFNDQQQQLLNDVSVDIGKYDQYQAHDNAYPPIYGNGLLYYAKKKGDIDYGDNPFIEMNGQLVPVNVSQAPNGVIRYAICAIKRYHGADHHAVEWDGRRWLFETDSAPQASKQLIEYLTDTHFEQHINLLNVSPPDEYGLREDGAGRRLLKIKSHYVSIHPTIPSSGNGRQLYNFFHIMATPTHPRINLQFKENYFVMETQQARIEHLINIPFNSDNETALDRLEKQCWLDKNSAEALLARYQFPSKGLFSAPAFAIDIEQTGQIPQWATLFEKQMDALPKSNDSTVNTISVFTLDLHTQKRTFQLATAGQLSNNKEFGKLFLDGNNSHYRIKQYVDYPFDQQHPTIIDYAKEEVRLFQHYFGAEAAELFYDIQRHYYIRFYSISGHSLYLENHTLPKYAAERLLDLLEKMILLGIHHGDLHANELIWSQEANQFYPLNPQRIASSYYYSGQIKHLDIPRLNDQQIAFILTQITDKIEA